MESLRARCCEIAAGASWLMDYTAKDARTDTAGRRSICPRTRTMVCVDATQEEPCSLSARPGRGMRMVSHRLVWCLRRKRHVVLLGWSGKTHPRTAATRAGMRARGRWRSAIIAVCRLRMVNHENAGILAERSPPPGCPAIVLMQLQAPKNHMGHCLRRSIYDPEIQVSFACCVARMGRSRFTPCACHAGCRQWTSACNG